MLTDLECVCFLLFGKSKCYLSESNLLKSLDDPDCDLELAGTFQLRRRSSSSLVCLL